MEDEKATREGLAEKCREFMYLITDEVERREIPAPAVLGLFGMFARSIADELTENGMKPEEAIARVTGKFMQGLGVTAVVTNVKTGENGTPPTKH